MCNNKLNLLLKQVWKITSNANQLPPLVRNTKSQINFLTLTHLPTNLHPSNFNYPNNCNFNKNYNKPKFPNNKSNKPNNYTNFNFSNNNTNKPNNNPHNPNDLKLWGRCNPRNAAKTKAKEPPKNLSNEKRKPI